MNRAAAPPSEADRIVFSLWALFWLLMIFISVEDHRRDAGIRWWEPLVWEGSSCVVGTAWLLLQRRAARAWDHLLPFPARWFGRHLLWLPLVAVSFVVLVYALRHGIYALTSETYEHEPWPFLLLYESIKLLLYAGLWLNILFGLASFDAWRHERDRLLTLQKHLAESQLAQLRAQLQPHFLFNTLNTISSLMHVDVARADQLLARLADLLRVSLAHARQSTSLREELEVLRLYASIMQERFADRVTLRWDISDDTLGAQVPAMLLQPLLENAYKHGVERGHGAVAILVTARRDEGSLRVTIHNNGTLDAGASRGIGIANCRERLALAYGADASLALESDATGVTASVTLPFERPAA